MNEFDLILVKVEKRITRLETILEFKYTNISNYGTETVIAIGIIKEELKFLKELLADLTKNPIEIKDTNEVVL